MKILSIALGLMFIQQSFVTIGKVLPAVIAPPILLELKIDPSWLGVYVGIIAAVSLAVQAGCGSVIVRYGALRISQVTLLVTGLGLVLAMSGLIFLMVLSAIAIGISASSTPASSHLLGKYAPAKYAPLIFSIKQTAVPVGLLTAGLAGPILTDFYGWRIALMSVVGVCVLFAIVLEFMRDEFDDDRDSTRKFQLSDFKGTIGLVLRQRELRSLALGCFAFVGLQTTFIAYFVIYLTELGFSLIEAGTVFSLATAVAIPGRIFWGWISSSFINPRVMLGLLAIFMFITVSLTSMFNANWASWFIVVVSAGVSATVFSWHGVTLAEAARLAPSSMRGAVTGGVLSFGQFGGLVLPLIYSLCLSITGSYQLGFFVCGVPALAVGVLLLQSSLKYRA
jgi:sugar phosphate permease